jgi:hypothetical protein
MDKLPTFDEMTILPIQLEDLEGAQSLFCFDIRLNPLSLLCNGSFDNSSYRML